MKFIRDIHNITEQHRGCALTIGNFDGLHLGHQALLRQLKQSAEKHNCPTCLMTFDPLPSEYFNKEAANARLMNTREKLNAFDGLSNDLCPDNYLLLAFNKRLSSMTAEDFIQNVLVETLQIKSLIVGDDFRFGKGRLGNFELLLQAGEKHGFEVTSLSTHQIDDLRVSSTRIREALQNGQFAQADKMMGRPYTICGRIVHGDKRGRTIGFPTANIRLRRLKSPIHGVYSVTMHTKELGDISGVANIGSRPTVNGEHIQLEVHLFDFEEDIYGYNVCVSFHHKIRGEKKFDSIEDLKKQIAIDCETARSHIQ